MPNPAEGAVHLNHAPDLRRRPSIHGTLLRYASHSHLQILTHEPVKIRLCARPPVTAFPDETQRHISSTRTTQTIAYQRCNRCFRLISIGNGCNEVSVETHEHPRSVIHSRERTGSREGNSISRRGTDCRSQCALTLHSILGGITAARQQYVEPVMSRGLGIMERACPECGPLH